MTALCSELPVAQLTFGAVRLPFMDRRERWQESEIALNRGPGRGQFHTQGLRIETQSLNNRFFRSLLC